MSLVAGLVLALAAVLLVLEPLLRAASGHAVTVAEPLFSDSDDESDPRLARRDRALAAIKEIDFDRATGKLSDDDYARLKTQYTAEALEALREADAAAAPDTASAISHLPSPVPDDVERLIATARGASANGRRFCLECGTPLTGSRRFCLDCGTALPTA